MNNCRGFTFIEMMMVFVIIGIIAGIAVPNFQTYRDRACLAEGFALCDSVRKNVLEYYYVRGVFPADNVAAGLPEPAMIKGKYVKSIAVKKGVVSAVVELSSKLVSLTLTPFVNRDYVTGPVVFKDKIKTIKQ